MPTWHEPGRPAGSQTLGRDKAELPRAQQPHHSPRSLTPGQVHAAYLALQEIGVCHTLIETVRNLTRQKLALQKTNSFLGSPG